MVKFLVNLGANVHVQYNRAEGTPGKKFGTPLGRAASLPYADILKYLLEAGADANRPMSSSHFGSPLAIGAHHGLVENVRILVEDGKADANALLSPDARGGISFGPSFGSALEATVTGTRGVSSEIIIRYLVTRGEAEVELQTIATYEPALAAAAAIHHGRYRDPLGPMIELGANVNLPLSAGEYGSALIAAAASGSMGKSQGARYSWRRCQRSSHGRRVRQCADCSCCQSQYCKSSDARCSRRKCQRSCHGWEIW
jgi:ankyrin repeat protein